MRVFVRWLAMAAGGGGAALGLHGGASDLHRLAMPSAAAVAAATGGGATVPADWAGGWGAWDPRALPVSLEAWWTHGPETTKDFGHLHAEMRLPLGQAVHGVLRFPVRVVLHHTPARLTRLRIDDDSGVRARVPLSHTCPADQSCAWSVPVALDTAALADGWREIRVRVEAETPDGKKFVVTGGIPLRVENGAGASQSSPMIDGSSPAEDGGPEVVDSGPEAADRSRETEGGGPKAPDGGPAALLGGRDAADDDAAANTGKVVDYHRWCGDRSLIGRGWYTDIGYVNSVIECVPLAPIAGWHTFRFYAQKGGGRVQITLDKTHHVPAAGPFGPRGPASGIVLYDDPGGIAKWHPITLDTTRLANGWHSLAMVTTGDEGLPSECESCNGEANFLAGIARFWFYVRN